MGRYLDKMIFVDSLRIYGFYAAGGVYRSTDGGFTWERRDQDIPTSHWYRELCMDPNGTLYLATDEGIYRSTDGMESWKYIQGMITETTITAAAVARDGTVYCAPLRTGVFKSTNKGQDWEQCLGRQLDRMDITCLLVAPDGWIYAGAEPVLTDQGGVWRSKDGGGSWEKLSTGMTTEEIELLHLGKDGYLYAGTFGSGVFRSADKVTAVSPPHAPSAPEISHEMYPSVIGNAGTAQLRLALQAAGNLRITIYDRLGRLLRYVYEGEGRPGEQIIPVHGEGLSSGMYLCRIEFGRRVYSNTLFVIK
jgi:photosystem II stability/assembly factor-like uncharacterized protein